MIRSCRHSSGGLGRAVRSCCIAYEERKSSRRFASKPEDSDGGFMKLTENLPIIAGKVQSDYIV